jgi:hypothetical protein
VTPSEKVAPSKRQKKLLQAGYHSAGVWCVLFGKFAETRSRLIGNPKRQTGNQRLLNTHAEQLWWDDLANLKALSRACRAGDLERLEFEITGDFCGKLDSNEPSRITCKSRFKEARMIAGKGKQIFIFIIRKHIYYNINDDGSIVFGGSWGDHQTIHSQNSG